MKSLRANISACELPERRRSVRWHVELIVSAGSAHDLSKVVVRNLSETGLLLQTNAALEVGETILIDMPGTQTTEARVMWHRESCFGCEFSAPLPSSVISAALLQAPLEGIQDGLSEPALEEFPVAIAPSVDELSDWKARFEATRGRDGYRLIAFRQGSDGLLIAIAAKTARARRRRHLGQLSDVP